MLTIQSVLNVLVDINLVDNLVGIVLQGSSEDNDFVELGH